MRSGLSHRGPRKVASKTSDVLAAYAHVMVLVPATRQRSCDRSARLHEVEGVAVPTLKATDALPELGAFELTACAGTLRGMTGQRLWFSGSSSGNGSRVCCFKEGSLTRIFRKFSRAC
jgi:hypothetical protein